MIELIDTHTHLNDKTIAADLAGVMARANAEGITRMICPGYSVQTSSLAVKIASEKANVWATVGVHPHDAAKFDDAAMKKLSQLAGEPKVVAIGEIGLDYYRDLSPRPVQQEVFRIQLRLAKELGLPVVIHNRDAGEDILKILEEEGAPPASGVMHCFSEDADYAIKVTDLGFYIGIAGPVTYGKNEKLRQVVERITEDRLLIETDAPYLTPEPFRGRRRNEPALVRYVAEKIAEIRGIDLEAVARITTCNAMRIFRGMDAGSSPA
jgi:TatD DNase family protein